VGCRKTLKRLILQYGGSTMTVPNQQYHPLECKDRNLQPPPSIPLCHCHPSHSPGPTAAPPGSAASAHHPVRMPHASWTGLHGGWAGPQEAGLGSPNPRRAVIGSSSGGVSIAKFLEYVNLQCRIVCFYRTSKLARHLSKTILMQFQVP
jgi:hypothetical protein